MAAWKNQILRRAEVRYSFIPSVGYKEPMGLLDKRILSPLLVLPTFSYDFFFNEFFKKLVIKNIYTYLSKSHVFCVLIIVQ
jgi:hypothetical protein